MSMEEKLAAEFVENAKIVGEVRLDQLQALSESTLLQVGALIVPGGGTSPQ